MDGQRKDRAAAPGHGRPAGAEILRTVRADHEPVGSRRDFSGPAGVDPLEADRRRATRAVQRDRNSPRPVRRLGRPDQFIDRFRSRFRTREPGRRTQPRPPRLMELKFILEAVLFSAQKPLSPAELRDVLAEAAGQAEDETARAFGKVKPSDLNAALEQLARDHAAAARSYRLACVAGSWQFVSQPEYAPWLKALVGEKMRPSRLSQPALETLAIIAYRQPLTRAEIEQIRGVSVDGVMQTLSERGLIQQIGRAEVVGHPMTYGTTSLFLEYFGLRSLEDLPAADELRRIPAQKPELLLAVEPGLATAPPEQLILEAAGGHKPEAGGVDPETGATKADAAGKQNGGSSGNP